MVLAGKAIGISPNEPYYPLYTFSNDDIDAGLGFLL